MHDLANIEETFVKSKYTGAEMINSHGTKCKVIGVLPKGIFIVEFDNGYIGKCHHGAFLDKEVKSPYCKSVYGVGYLGEGEFVPTKNGIITKEYHVWISMLERCYSERYLKINKSYQGCFVYDEWHNFQNFAKWYSENYYKVEDKTMCLDKDILFKGNKEYSPEKCCIVPDTINNLFVSRKRDRGKYLMGVVGKKCGKYIASVSKYGEIIHLGCFNTEEQAHLAYKTAKEAYLKEIAFKYINDIPHNVYMALVNYEVEIGD